MRNISSDRAGTIGCAQLIWKSCLCLHGHHSIRLHFLPLLSRGSNCLPLPSPSFPFHSLTYMNGSPQTFSTRLHRLQMKTANTKLRIGCCNFSVGAVSNTCWNAKYEIDCQQISIVESNLHQIPYTVFVCACVCVFLRRKEPERTSHAKKCLRNIMEMQFNQDSNCASGKKRDRARTCMRARNRFDIFIRSACSGCASHRRRNECKMLEPITPTFHSKWTKFTKIATRGRALMFGCKSHFIWS